MPSKVNKMSDARKPFASHLRKLHKQEAEEVLKEFEKETKEVLNRTNRGQSSPYGGFSDIRPRIIKNIIVLPQGVVFKARVYMSNPSNQPHEIWHYINSGTKSRVVKSGKSFVARFPIANRTFPNKLDSGNFTGYKPKWHYFRAGTRVKGITARNFYKKALARLNQTFFKKKKVKAWTVREKEFDNG